MPVYQIGDLVVPNPIHWQDEDNPGAIGLILEMRSMLNLKPEAKILWNDMLDRGPGWMFISEVQPLKEDPHV